jgi:hypothetical protein
MPQVTVQVRQQWSLWRMLGSLTMLACRFFTGFPMRKTRRDNASFLKGATKGSPGKVLSQWQKKPYLHRALIRNGVFWPVCGISILLTVNRTAALLVLTFASIPGAYLAFRKIRFFFFLPFTSTDSVSGDISQHWILRNKWRRLSRRQPVAGQVARKDRIVTEFSADVEETLRKALGAEEDGLGGVPALKIKPYRRR